MEDKGLDFTKPPLEPDLPSINRSAVRSCLMRETGFKFKSNSVPTELQWAAEDRLVSKDLEEYRCKLPDVSRSTFLMVFSPDGTKVASTHGNHNVYVSDLTSGKNVKTLTGHPRTPWCIAFHPSSNQILASGCLGGQVRVWDLSGGSEIWMAESQTVIASLAFHPVDRMLVIASYNELHFWDWSQPEPFAKCFTANEREKVRYVAFDALGHKLITGVANAPARVASQWDRVAAPQPPPPSRELDSERRITICYRYMVEQYEQLVERYFDLSRVRNTLTMDRGTDPMDFEGEASSSDGRNTAPNTSRPLRPPGRLFARRVSNFSTPQTSRLSSGTDEVSASHSSTNFLSPEVSINVIPPVTQPLLATSSSDTSIDNGNSARNETPTRTIRFNVAIPASSSFNFRLSTSSAPSTTSSPNQAFPSQSTVESSRTRPLSLSPESLATGRPSSHQSETPDQNNERSESENGEIRTTVESSPPMPNLINVPSWTNRSNPSDGTGTSTEVNDSENEEPVGYEELQTESQSDDVPLSSTSRAILTPNVNLSRSPRNSEASPRRLSEASAVSQLRSQFHRLQSAYENRNSGQSSMSHAFSPEQNSESSRFEAVLDRLWNDMVEHSPLRPRANQLFPSRRSAFQPRTPTTSTAAGTNTTAAGSNATTASRSNSTAAGSNATAGGSSARIRGLMDDWTDEVVARLENSQSLDRGILTQVLNNLEEMIRRPNPRFRRQSVRRGLPRTPPIPSPATPTTSSGAGAAATPSPDIISGVRYGIQLLSRHIDNMQRLCRARLEILQLQQIRRMWEDLQSQIYALHGAVREGETEAPQASTSRQSTDPNITAAASATATATTSTDQLTDDDSDNPSSLGDFHWRLRRTPQMSNPSNRPRPPNRWFVSRPSRNLPVRRSRMGIPYNRVGDFSYNRRFQMPQSETSRRELNRQTSSSTQEERGEASSSHVSGETSTGTSDEPGARVRGVKRKSRDSDPLFRPRPSSSNTQPQTSTNPSNPQSSLLTIMRGLINQLENMGQRSRHVNPQHRANNRMSRFIRQREERRMRNLWDTESSHESSRDDQSEGDSSQRSTPEGIDAADSEWTGDSTRLRARQVLLLMVDSLMQFFENDNLPQRSSNEALNERIQNLYTLLQLALHLTDLLLAQLVNSRREMEAMRPVMEGVGSRRAGSGLRRAHDRFRARPLPRYRIFRRNLATNPTSNTPPATASTSPAAAAASAATFPTANSVLNPNPSRTIPLPYRSALLSHYHQVPIVRVNDLPAPPPEAAPVPRFRPHSPPPMNPNPMFVPARFLLPARYGYSVEESTSEDSSPHDRSSDLFFIRDTPMSPHHRIQAWDFSRYNLPDLGNSDKNIVVSECRIHNDASVDVSKDGRLLVTLLPSGRLSLTSLLGIYSLQWNTLGQLLYTTSFEQSIVSVSLSPTSRHLVVGLASRRVALVNSDRHPNAQIFRLEGGALGRKVPITSRGRLAHLRDLELGRHPMMLMSLNCIRWSPNPGQGMVFGTNTGQLKVLR